MRSIVISYNPRGQILVRIISTDGSIHDWATFASPDDALAWARAHIKDLQATE